ncbi:MAG: ArsA family ATPase [Thermoplasmatota archaeon]
MTRISLVLGKGGVGKTTVAAALAARFAAGGDRVLLASLTATAELARRIEREGAGIDTGGRLELLEVAPRALVDDLVRRVTRLGPIADMVVASPAYESLVEISPGVREMAIFNRLFEIAARGTYDRIVLDGPATGHGVNFLEAPKKTAAMLVGALKQRAEAIEAMLRDPGATEVVLVTLPEETPVRETVELAAKLAATGLAIDNIVVNKWFPRVFEDAGPRHVLAALEEDVDTRKRLGRAIAHRSRIDVDEWLAALDVVRGEREESVVHTKTLAALGAKLAIVLYVPGREGRLARVAADLARRTEAPA